MEQVRLQKGATGVIDVRYFFENWDRSVMPGLVSLDSQFMDNEVDVIAREMGVSVDTVQELNSVCGVDTLKNGDEHPDHVMLTSIPDDLDLAAVKFQRQDLKHRAEDSIYRQFVTRKIKHKTVSEKLCPFKFGPEPESGRVPIPIEHQVGFDVMLEISVHCPLTTQNARMNIPKLVIDQKFQVFGNQVLIELRDKISCVNDLAIAGDSSENPDDVTGFYAKDVYRSGFFYIEGVFYNDMREVDSHDYSSVIRSWAAEPDRGIGQLTTANMEESRFIDLKVRLGQPYLYLHQGTCEHILIFNDIRLIHSGDLHDKREYPKLIFKKNYRRTVCRVCHLHSARWLTYGSEHAPDDPSFFCDQCYRALHYDKDGNKIGNFKAHKFFDKHAVV